MQLSTRGRYAVVAMADLALRDAIGCACGPVCLAEIASSQQLSLSYLEQVFGKLRRAGLVTSLRGPGGGYRLARPSDQISIAEIFDAIEGNRSTSESSGHEAPCCPAHELWAELGRHVHLFLETITLADVLSNRVLGRAAPPLEAATHHPTPTEAALAE